MSSTGDLWPQPCKPGTGSRDFPRAGRTPEAGHTWSLHDSLPLTVAGGRLEDYRKVTPGLGGL